MYENYIETKAEIATRKQNQNEFDLRTTATGKQTPFKSTSNSVCNQGSCRPVATGKKLLVRRVLYNSVIKINKTMQITRPTKTRRQQISKAVQEPAKLGISQTFKPAGGCGYYRSNYMAYERFSMLFLSQNGVTPIRFQIRPAQSVATLHP